MPLLGPSPGGGQQQQQLSAQGDTPKGEGLGIAKLLLFGVIGLGLFKVLSGSSEEELEGT